MVSRGSWEATSCRWRRPLTQVWKHLRLGPESATKRTRVTEVNVGPKRNHRGRNEMGQRVLVPCPFHSGGGGWINQLLPPTSQPCDHEEKPLMGNPQSWLRLQAHRHVNISSSRDMRRFGERETERQSCKQPVSVRRRKIGLLINNKSLVHLPYISCLHLCHFGNRLLFTFQPLLLVHSHICQCGILSNTALYWSGI